MSFCSSRWSENTTLMKMIKIWSQYHFNYSFNRKKNILGGKRMNSWVRYGDRLVNRQDWKTHYIWPFPLILFNCATFVIICKYWVKVSIKEKIHTFHFFIFNHPSFYFFMVLKSVLQNTFAVKRFKVKMSDIFFEWAS